MNGAPAAGCGLKPASCHGGSAEGGKPLAGGPDPPGIAPSVPCSAAMAVLNSECQSVSSSPALVTTVNYPGVGVLTNTHGNVMTYSDLSFACIKCDKQIERMASTHLRLGNRTACCRLKASWLGFCNPATTAA